MKLITINLKNDLSGKPTAGNASKIFVFIEIISVRNTINGAGLVGL